MALNLTQLTLDEIIKLQGSRSIFAVGKYQGIPVTISDWINSDNVPTSTVFNTATQEQFGTYLLTKKRPAVGNYVYQRGNVTLEQAQTALAQEFASLPKPGPRESAVGYYDGDTAGNRALTTSGELQDVLIQARNGKNLQLLKDFLAKFEGRYDSVNIIPKVGDRVRAPQIGTDEYYAPLPTNAA